MGTRLRPFGTAINRCVDYSSRALPGHAIQAGPSAGPAWHATQTGQPVDPNEVARTAYPLRVREAVCLGEPAQQRGMLHPDEAAWLCEPALPRGVVHLGEEFHQGEKLHPGEAVWLRLTAQPRVAAWGDAPVHLGAAALRSDQSVLPEEPVQPHGAVCLDEPALPDETVHLSGAVWRHLTTRPRAAAWRHPTALPREAPRSQESTAPWP